MHTDIKQHKKWQFPCICSISFAEIQNRIVELNIRCVHTFFLTKYCTQLNDGRWKWCRGIRSKWCASIENQILKQTLLKATLHLYVKIHTHILYIIQRAKNEDWTMRCPKFINRTSMKSRVTANVLLHPPCDVVHHEGPCCTPVVAPSHSSEALLPGRVPDLKFDLLSGDFYDSVNNERLISSTHSKWTVSQSLGKFWVFCPYQWWVSRKKIG